MYIYKYLYMLQKLNNSTHIIAIIKLTVSFPVFCRLRRHLREAPLGLLWTWRYVVSLLDTIHNTQIIIKPTKKIPWSVTWGFVKPKACYRLTLKCMFVHWPYFKTGFQVFDLVYYLHVFKSYFYVHYSYMYVIIYLIKIKCSHFCLFGKWFIPLNVYFFKVIAFFP